MPTNVTQVVVPVQVHRNPGYAAAQLLFHVMPTDRALIGWQPFGGGYLGIGGDETYISNEAAGIVDAVNGYPNT